MTLIAAVAVVIAATVLFTLTIRSKDIPPPEPVSPTRHLEDRKAAIYENLRDLQFEYRVGKLSDEDYQRTKLTLQQELAGVLAEIDRILPGGAARVAVKVKTAAPVFTCPNCGAEFSGAMKFCGECGKAMS